MFCFVENYKNVAKINIKTTVVYSHTKNYNLNPRTHFFAIGGEYNVFLGITLLHVFYKELEAEIFKLEN